jgi:hypothetical protein
MESQIKLPSVGDVAGRPEPVAMFSTNKTVGGIFEDVLKSAV